MTENKQTTALISQSLVQAEILSRRSAKLSKLLTLWTTKLEKHQNARLISGGLFFLALIGLTVQSNLGFESLIIVVFMILFTWLVIRTRRIQRHLSRLQRLKQFVQRQENRCRGQASGAQWESVDRLKSSVTGLTDLGLFGSHSLWTLLNETMTDGGERELLSWITSSPRSAVQIQEKQRQVQKLRRETWFYTRLTLESDRDQFRLSSQQILEFIKAPLVAENFKRSLMIAWTTWIAALIGIFLSVQNEWKSAGLFAFVFAVVSFLLVNKTGDAFKQGVGLAHHLNELEPVFAALEKRTPGSAILQQLCPQIHASGPAKETKKLNRALSFLSVQANPLVFLILNAVVPWTMTAGFFLEERRKKIAQSFPDCLKELATLEAFGSLVIFDRYQTQVYPTVLEKNDPQSRYSFEGLFHPLIERSKVVANDFQFQGTKSLGLLTGSNMSGKSTFLRSCGVNQLLANMGAPVFAEKLTTSPLKIETCIEVSDSLRDGFSYFYSEVRRLKAILKAAQTGEPLLFLIDEIFRGTNNRERQIGSQAVIRSLAKSTNALGFVSTHDLELTALETQYPSVLNLHFREHITEAGEMIFSYHLNPGPSPTTNALKIMAAEGIDVSGLQTL